MKLSVLGCEYKGLEYSILISEPLNVTVDRVSVTDNGRLEIIWKWNENRRRKRSRGAEEVGIHMKSSVAGDVSKRAKRSVALDDVSVRANYSTDGGLVWSLYPEDRGVPVREGRMMVHGEFKRDMDVLVSIWGLKYHETSCINCTQILKLKCFSSHIAVIFAQSIEARC